MISRFHFSFPYSPHIFIHASRPFSSTLPPPSSPTEIMTSSSTARKASFTTSSLPARSSFNIFPFSVHIFACLFVKIAADIDTCQKSTTPSTSVRPPSSAAWNHDVNIVHSLVVIGASLNLFSFLVHIFLHIEKNYVQKTFP